jgi:hypothetical protein
MVNIILYGHYVSHLEESDFFAGDLKIVRSNPDVSNVHALNIFH